MSERKTVAALVVGGEATAGPPLGPALGPLGLNVMAVVKEINEQTKQYAGMRVPVKVHVDQGTKQFEVEVGVPTTAALIAKETGIPKGTGTPHTTFAGNLTMQQVVRIARAKLAQSYAADAKAAAKEVIGTCVSMGIQVEGRNPRELAKEIDAGQWDRVLTT